jgi:lipopolysaccharide export system protein LptC
MMAEATVRERVAKPRWAEPGSGHDRIIRWAKILLPSAVGILIAILTIAPLEKKGDVSFILDKKKVQTAPERMRVESARYTGTDNKGQQFVMVANRAVQRSSDNPVVDIRGMRAKLDQPQGPLMIAANQGRYNIDTQKVAIDGPVKVTGQQGFQLSTSNVLVDLNQRQLASQGPAQGAMRLGHFQAGHISANLDDKVVVLDGGARLKIVQGTVR